MEVIIALVKAAMSGDKNALKQVEQIMQAAKSGDQKAVQLAQMIQEVAKKLQQGVKAKLGAKLNYIKRLKGECPEGQELVYMKRGGRMCPVCVNKKGKKLNKKKSC